MDFIHGIDYYDDDNADADDDNTIWICLIISSVYRCWFNNNIESKISHANFQVHESVCQMDCWQGAFVKPQFIIVF